MIRLGLRQKEPSILSLSDKIEESLQSPNKKPNRQRKLLKSVNEEHNFTNAVRTERRKQTALYSH